MDMKNVMNEEMGSNPGDGYYSFYAKLKNENEERSYMFPTVWDCFSHGCLLCVCISGIELGTIHEVQNLSTQNNVSIPRFTHNIYFDIKVILT